MERGGVGEMDLKETLKMIHKYCSVVKNERNWATTKRKKQLKTVGFTSIYTIIN